MGSGQRTAVAIAAYHEARSEDQRDCRTLGVRVANTVEIRCKTEQLGARSGASAGMGRHLVAVAEAIDQFCRHRFISQEWSAIDRVAYLGVGQFAPLRDTPDDLPRH